MKIILNQEIEGLGEEGQIVSVKDGFARNYLIPRGLAKNATTKNIVFIQKEIEDRQKHEAKTRENLEALTTQLNKFHYLRLRRLILFEPLSFSMVISKS